MADDDHGAAGAEEPTGPVTASAMVGKLTTNEQLIALGALLILVLSDLVGDVLVDEYSVSSKLYLVSAAVVAVIIAVKIRGASTPTSYTWIVRALGLLVFIFGVREFIGDIESSNYLGGSNIIYALGLYAGTLLVAYGAYQMQGE